MGAIRATIDAVDADQSWIDGLAAAQFTGAEVEIRALERKLDRGDTAAIERALRYVEADPYYFRSGYARQRIGRKLARQPLTDPQRERARVVVLRWVDGTIHCGRAAGAALARATANNALRRALRARLHNERIDVGRRALHALLRVKHPGFNEHDLHRMRDIVLADATRFQWLAPIDYRAALRLWSREWRDELIALSKSHGPDRKAAKFLLEAADRRAQKRTGS